MEVRSDRGDGDSECLRGGFGALGAAANCDLSRMYGIRYYSPTPSSNKPISLGSSRDASGSPQSSPTSSPTPSAVCGSLTLFSFVSEPKFDHDVTGVGERDAKSVAKSSHFGDGLLLCSREKGVLLPAIHISDSVDGPGLRVQANLQGEVILSKDYVAHRGLYQEVRKIVPDTELPRVAPIPQEQHNIGYMLLGFKSVDRNFSEVMLDTWKDWTGARYIYMYLPDDLGLRRISFFHRQLPDDLNLFTYLVLVECHGITSQEKEVRLLDFAQRMRLERLTGYISVYTGSRIERRSPKVALDIRHLETPDFPSKGDKPEISESLFPNGISGRSNSRM